MLNKQKPGIPWCTHTLNPFYGCSGAGCDCRDQCYAKLVNDRFDRGDFRRPKFLPERLKALKDGHTPMVVFIGSMSDSMDDAFEDWQIDEVISRLADHSQSKFLWLSKHPYRFKHFRWPANCWLGTTITGSVEDRERKDHLLELNRRGVMTFWSAEPIINPELLIQDIHSHWVDWIIFGAMTNGAGQIDPGYPVDLNRIRAAAAIERSFGKATLIKPPLGDPKQDFFFPESIEPIIKRWKS